MAIEVALSEQEEIASWVRSGGEMLYDTDYKKELLEYMERFKRRLEIELDDEERQSGMDMTDEDNLI